MRFLKSLLILVIFVCFCSAKIKVNPETLQLVDEFGRTRLYHGVNVVYKIFPFYPNTETFDSQLSLTDGDLQNLRNWGVNFIRLYASWQGLEAVKGQYNQTLLNKILEITQMAAKYNISILLDAHQDVYNQKFCGEGAPDWTVQDSSSFPFPVGFFKLPKDNEGYPQKEACLKKSFAEYYFSYDTAKAFQDLYDNVNGIQDHFGQMWYLLADTFKDQENVIGYEIINEPFNGNIYKNPLLLYNSDKENLQPFYKNINQRIRQADNNTIVFFEPTVFDIMSITFDDTPGGIEYRDRQVFSYHVYCGISTNSKFSNWACNEIDQLLFINSRTKKAQELGVAAFLTEFGAISDTPDDLKQIDYVTSQAEKRFQGWSYWQFKAYGDYTTTAGGTSESFYDDNGNLQTGKVKSISRPYFYAICGQPVSTDFNTETGTFEFEFIYNKCSNGKNSELYLSEDYYYSKGFTSAYQGCERCQLGKINDKYYYELIVPDEYQGKNVKLQIQA